MGVKAATEREFQRAVVQFADLHGWWAFHQYDSRRSAAGLPDLLLVRRGVMVWAELKTRTGRVREAQGTVLALLREVADAAGGAVVVRLWRDTPEGWADIQEVLG
jgi:hypothetical protein